MTLVIGVGNADRGDDAVGLVIARRVREAIAPGSGDVTVAELVGDQLGLLDAWAGADDVYVIDAVRSGGTPGAVYRFDATQPLGTRFRHPGSHTFSLADVVELGRALGRVPGRLVGYGIEGASFTMGAPLSPQAADAVSAVTGQLLGELAAK
jgi:hydrogenase maturation protease